MMTMTWFLSTDGPVVGSRRRHADFKFWRTISPLLSQTTTVTPASPANPGGANPKAACASRATPNGVTTER